MGLYGMMRTSVSGMAAQASRLSSVADNIANADTVGYRRSQIEFHTQVLDSQAGDYASGAVGLSTHYMISQQGAIRPTNSPTDLAIRGDGFFVVRDGSDINYLTRAGSFQIDQSGYLVNSAGYTLLGYDVTNSGTATVTGGYGNLVPIQVGSQELESSPTNAAVLRPNLPSNADIVAAGSLPSDNVASTEYSGKTSMVVYDNLGNEKLIDVYFAKTAANTWEVTAFNSDDSTNGSFPYSSAPLGQSLLSFDPSNGYVVGGGAVSLSVPIPGGVTMDVDLTGISQLGTSYQVLTSSTNGNSPTSIDRVEVDNDGTVFGIFRNGFAKPLYRLALGKVVSTDNLQTLPGNTYSISADSGDIIVGTAELHGFGTIIANALEESNVDMATELTIMIEAQRSYTANSKVFQTGSELMDVLVNLKR